MIAIFVVIGFAIKAAFRDNPGISFGFHAPRNFLYMLSQSYQYYHYVGVGIIALAIFYQWREKPVFLRKAMSLAAVLLALASICGYVDEFRAFYEIYPIAFLLITHSICRVLDIPMKVRERIEVAERELAAA